MYACVHMCIYAWELVRSCREHRMNFTETSFLVFSSIRKYITPEDEKMLSQLGCKPISKIITMCLFQFPTTVSGLQRGKAEKLFQSSSSHSTSFNKIMFVFPMEMSRTKKELSSKQFPYSAGSLFLFHVLNMRLLHKKFSVN